KTNRADVEFIAGEGRKMKIRKIYIEGNKYLPDKRILKLIKTKKAWLFGGGILKEDVLGEDMERVKSLYLKEGFSDVTVAYEVKQDLKKPYLDIMIKINEGKQYFVGVIRFTGNSVIDDTKILNALESCLPGKIYSVEGVQKDQFIIQGLYFELGYITVGVGVTTVLNPTTDAIDIAYSITENEIAYINKVKIRGNVKTKDTVIRRELRFYPGDKFEGPKLRRSKERLMNLGFFEEVSFNDQATGVPNQHDLIVEVKEQKTGTFSFGGGYSTVNDFIGFTEIEQRNFDWRNFPYFTGDGQDLKLRTEIGTVSANYSLSFTEPWLYDYPISFGFDLYRLSHERENDIGWGYDETKTGGDIRLGKELSEYTKGSLAYRLEEIKISDIDPTASNELKKEVGTNNISSIELGISYDARDNVFDPHKGVVMDGNLDIAGGFFGGDKDFYQFRLGASRYFPFWRDSVFEVRGRMGLADAYGSSSELPIYERFFAGGGYSIRGYEERTVGPIDPSSKDPLGGNALLTGSIEYTYPVFDFLRLATFYDVGNVWAKLSDFASGGFKAGFGFGARIKTPMGPLRLDYAFPLNKQPGEDEKKTGRFHFSMGGGF
ncbi:MAG: outer membrane protein assembly factor BamA, partial [Candidatus Omnitrophota bacterium]